MFKSKLNFKVFDKNDRSVPHLTTVKMKNCARASCGRLSNEHGKTTPFHLILNYFDDQPGEPKGHFIDFGNHNTLEKHFNKVETKPGGQQKRFSESVKDSAAGLAFVAKKDGKEVVYLVPTSSKIPPTGWSQFLKKAKTLFGNRKGIVLSEQEWKALQASEKETAILPKETTPYEAQLNQVQIDLEALQNNSGSAITEEQKAGLAAHKITLQSLIQKYNGDKSAVDGRKLQAVIETWKSLQGE